MLEQLKNPSALRKEHDLQAIEDGPIFELSRLQEYLLADKADKNDSEGITKAKQALNETLVHCYEKSPTFRRLYNHSVKTAILDIGGRYTLELEPQGKNSRRPLPVLIDTKAPQKEKHISATSYRSTTGERLSSSKRNLTEQLVSSITRLPNREENHPRGPVQEYTNIILKEIGQHYEPMMVSSIEMFLKSSTNTAETNSRSLLTSILAKDSLALKNSASPKGEKIYKSVKEALEKISQERLESIAMRPRISHSELQSKAIEDRQNAKMLPSMLLRLVKDIKDDENPLRILEKMAQQNFRQNIFSYRIDKYREPFDLVRHRDGDCSSLARLFSTLGKAAGIESINTVELDGKMDFTLSEKPEIPNLKGGQTVEFARHTILAVHNTKTETTSYFDPVFGCEVDPSHYGSDLSKYLIKT
ncbi:unnamed protein product [Ectocarpus sp. 12 AP-2014]